MAIEVAASATPGATARAAGAKPTAAPAGGVMLRRPRIAVRERMFFTERLALLLETGNPLHASLTLLAKQCENEALSKVASRLAEDIAGGMPFSRALAVHPDVFPSVYVNLVGAAEQGGFLPTVLAELTALEDKAATLRATVRSAFSYPMFLIVFSGGVVLFVLTFVFPKFADLFSSIRDQLPVSTLVLMTASDVLRQHWPVVLGGTAGAAFGVHRWLSRESGRALVDRLKLRIPVLKEMFAQFYLVQSMRVLGLSLEHGVSVPDALRACRDVVDNAAFRAFVADVERDVQEGRGVAPAFERADFMPDLARQLVATGEESGNLPLVMKRLAAHYEQELRRRLQGMAKLIEPIMLLVMGGVVGIIVASLILPIFKLSRAVGL